MMNIDVFWVAMGRRGFIFSENETYHLRKLFRHGPGPSDGKNGLKTVKSGRKMGTFDVCRFFLDLALSISPIFHKKGEPWALF